MHRSLRFFLNGCVVAFLLFVFLAAACAAGDDAPVFKITASIVVGKRVETTAVLRVALRVENVSGKPQLIRAESCSWYEDWKTDEPHIFAGGWNCEKNTLQTIEIAPGGWFTDELEISTDYTAARTVSFHMGFDPGNGGKRVWSNALEAKIDPTAKSTDVPAGWDGIGSRSWGQGCKFVPGG